MLAQFLVKTGISLLMKAVQNKIKGNVTFFDQQKIEAKINEVVVAVMEPMCSFLINENLTEQESVAYINAALPYITSVIENPELSFSKGLDAEIITKEILSSRVTDDTLQTISENPAAFETILRSIIDLIVRTPPIFYDWQYHSFRANYKQLDELRNTLNEMYASMKEIARHTRPDHSVFHKIIGHRASSTALKMNIHGLRQTPVPQSTIDDIYVLPSFSERVGLSNREPQTESGNPLRSTKPQIVEFSGRFEDALVLGMRAIVTAPAGAGKSTWANWFSSSILKSGREIFPVVVELRKMLRELHFPTLSELCLTVSSTVFRDLLTTAEVQQWAEKGRILLILDGFDEVSEGQRDSVVEWINALRSSSDNRIMTVITARPLTTNHLQILIEAGWRDFYLDQFDLPRVTRYIELFQTHGPQIQTGAMLKEPEALALEWQQDTTLQHLTGNPLLLSTLLIVHHMDGELPDDRAALYERYIDGMLGLWELNKELSPPAVPLTKNQKKKILELLAINMISLSVDAISEEDAERWLHNYVSEQNIGGTIHDVLGHLRERSGLLIGPGQYTFAHKSIGEFLVAQACADQIERDFSGNRFDRKLLETQCLNDRWTTVTFLWAGLASKIEVQEFISSLIEKNHIELAGGLLFERRKNLEREWVQANFWRLIRVASANGNIFNQPSHTSLVLHDGPQSIYLGHDQCAIHDFTSITNGLDESDIIQTFFNEKIVNPFDWQSHIAETSVLVWWIISDYTGYNDNIAKFEKKNLTTEASLYMLLRCSNFNNSGYFSADDLPTILKDDSYKKLSMYIILSILCEIVGASKGRAPSSQFKNFEDSIFSLNFPEIDLKDIDTDFYDFLEDVTPRTWGLVNEGVDSVSFRQICELAIKKIESFRVEHSDVLAKARDILALSFKISPRRAAEIGLKLQALEN